jgi:hypothetical protein
VKQVGTQRYSQLRILEPSSNAAGPIGRHILKADTLGCQIQKCQSPVGGISALRSGQVEDQKRTPIHNRQAGFASSKDFIGFTQYW